MLTNIDENKMIEIAADAYNDVCRDEDGNPRAWAIHCIAYNLLGDMHRSAVTECNDKAIEFYDENEGYIINRAEELRNE